MPTVTKSTVITSSTVPSNDMPLQIGVTPALWLDGADASTLISDGAASFASASSQTLSRTAANSTSLQCGDVDFWIAGWINVTSLIASGYAGIITKWSSTAANCEWSVNLATGTSRPNLSVRGPNTSTLVTHTSSLGTGSWKFVMAYHDAGNNTLNICINNGAFQSTAHSDGCQAGNNDVIMGRLGGFTATASYLDGKLDSFVFGKPSSGWLASKATELRDYLYNSGNGRRSSDFINSSYYLNGNPSGAVSWWDLDERSGTRNDRIGTNHLTDNNSVGYAAGIASGAVQYDGDPIKQWSDKSGNNRHLLAPSDSARPTYKTGVQNAKPVIRMDGVDDYLYSTQAIAGVRTVAFVVKHPNPTNLTDYAGYFSPVATSASLESIPSHTAGSTNFYTVTPASTYYRNGTQMLESASGAGPMNAFTICIFVTTSSAWSTYAFQISKDRDYSNRLLKADWCELMLFTSALSTSQRQRIERYLAEKWMSPPTVTLVTSSSSQYLEWAAVDMAGSYKVYYRVNGTTAWTLALTTTSLYAVITGLTVGTAYDFRVDAVWSV